MHDFFSHITDFKPIELPVNYVCGKCCKIHSLKDYEEDKFCRACSFFLLPTFTITRASDETNKTRELEQKKPSSDNVSKDKMALMRAAESLRQRIASTKEYTVIPEKQTETEPMEKPVESWIWNTEYDQAVKLKRKLIRKFKNKNLAEAIPGRVISNEQGECYSISSSCVSNFKTVNYAESRRLIISDLKIIPGIGPGREAALKRQGYSTIEELKDHPLWKKPAQAFMKLLDEKEIAKTQNWLGQRLPKSHPLAHYLAGFCNSESFAIIDIETLGLSERPIILLGIAKPNKNSVCTSQFLLRDIQDEPSAIWSLVSQLEPESSLITFNGRSFDVPYIKQRLAYYGLDASLDYPHFDVLHFTRRAFKKKLANCRLETVEKHFGIEREIDIPGALVPDFYDTYLRTGNVGPLVAIVEHNKQDLTTLGHLFSKLYEEWNL
jgi:uncharacterized protein